MKKDPHMSTDHTSFHLEGLISVDDQQNQPIYLQNPSLPLSIVYQDDDLIAINKSSGLLTHKSRIAEDEQLSAMERLRNHLNEWVYPVHRLDRATSGLLIFGRHREAAKALHESFAQGRVRKKYWAITRGHGPKFQIIDRPLKEKKDRITDKKAQLDKAPQSAYSEVTTLAHSTLALPLGRYETARFSLIQIQPKTGRRHQIRRHLAGINYPIIGDTTHGRGEQNRFFRAHFNCHRLLLAAVELVLPHPKSNELLFLQAPIDGVMNKVTTRLFKSQKEQVFYSKLVKAESQVTVKVTWLTDPEASRHLLASSQA